MDILNKVILQIICKLFCQNYFIQNVKFTINKLIPIILFCVIDQSHHETPIDGFEQYFKFFSMYKMKISKLVHVTSWRTIFSKGRLQNDLVDSSKNIVLFEIKVLKILKGVDFRRIIV